jgi:perosamine synthetase
MAPSRRPRCASDGHTMTTRRVPVAGPWITQREIDYAADAAAHAWYENAHSFNVRFERAVADYVGVRHAVATPSCTSALHLALAALDIGPGAEVIVPDVTWIASAAPISYVGAEPVFVDIDAESWCIDAVAFEQAITPATKAAVIVDLYGGMPAWDELETIARAAGITLIEDAAEAFGSEYRGRQAGSFGRVAAFSFHGSKTITTGEGGMLVTNDSDLYERVLVLRDHGRPPGDRLFCNDEIAFKYRMGGLQAALGLAQVERAAELVSRKREIFSWYQAQLGRVPGLTLNAEPDGVKNSYWMVTVVVDPGMGVNALELMKRLDDKGIDTRPFFRPLSSLPAYDWHQQAAAIRRTPERWVGYRVSPNGLNLPSGFNMTPELVSYVSSCLCDVLGVKL